MSFSFAKRIVAVGVACAILGFMLAVAIVRDAARYDKMRTEFEKSPVAAQGHKMIRDIGHLERGEYVEMKDGSLMRIHISTFGGDERAVVRYFAEGYTVGAPGEHTFEVYTVLSEVSRVVKKSDPDYKDYVLKFFDH